MTTKPAKRVRCAVYTRVSTEYGLDQEFNSLDAQHEAAEAYVLSVPRALPDRANTASA
jgi:site-specific DNA recombinase